MKNILEEIEGKYPVDTILVNGKEVWPYLRMAYYFGYRKDMASESGEEQSVPPLLKRLVKMVKNSFYGLTNWFRTYDYVVLSNTGQRRSINGKYFNRLLDPIIDELGRDRVLCVEIPAPSLYPTKKVHTENIVCNDLPTLVAAIRATVILKGAAIQNGSILKTIQEEHGLRIDDLKRVRSSDAQRRVYSSLFCRIKPKALLLSCYYGSNLPAVKAAKDLGIKVIEVQHGVIGKEHPAYNVYRDLDKSCFPDHLLVFGKRELATFSDSRFIDQANVHPVGSFYIDYIKSSYKPEPYLSELISGYKRVVGVTLQWILERRLISFTCEAAKLDSTILYMLIPRQPGGKVYSSVELPQNVMIITDRNFYQLMTYCDFHSTVNSTCALEAPSLGVQNILVDIDGLARQYYEKVLSDDRVTRFAGAPQEYVDIVRSFGRLDRNIVCQLHEDFFSTNYQENIHSFVKTHLL